MPKILKILRAISIVATRLVLAAFAAVASLSIPETRQLLNEDYVQDVKGTLTVPLKICKPTGVTLDGESITLDAEAGSDCHTLDFLVNACVMSFVFSIVAVGIFIIADIFARIGKGNPGTVGGMGLFLVFILLQTAVCGWTLVSEARFWETYFESLVTDYFNDQGIENVNTHGNSWLLMATGGGAVLCSALLVVEALISLCCDCKKSKSLEETEKENNLSGLRSSATEISCSEGPSPYLESDTKDWAAMNWANPF